MEKKEDEREMDAEELETRREDDAAATGTVVVNHSQARRLRCSGVEELCEIDLDDAAFFSGPLAVWCGPKFDLAFWALPGSL